LLHLLSKLPVKNDAVIPNMTVVISEIGP